MSQHQYEKIEFLGNYIDGQFHVPKNNNGEWNVVSPASLSDSLGTVFYSYQHSDDAVFSAYQSYKLWKKEPIENRAHYLKKYKEALIKKEEVLAKVISREMGKPLWEATSEVKTMVNKIDITLTEGLRLVERKTFDHITPDAQGVWENRPLGVMAVIGPFNFPGHLANGHIVPALLLGNTIVFKPSEKTPFVGQIMAECFHEAGFPKGVFNLVHGEKEVGRRLVTHEKISGVLFTGSYEVGNRIKQDTLSQYWKILALEMGGKNSTLICEDAHLEYAVRETLISSFITTGQRCSCTSRVLVHTSLVKKFISMFHEKSKKFSIGHPFENPFMGPLIDKTSLDRFIKFQGIATREGAEIIMGGKELLIKDYKGHYVTPSIVYYPECTLESVQKSVFQQTELFAPSVVIIPFSDLDEAVELANATSYGLVASVFSQSKEIYEKLKIDLEFGLINWNKSTVGASSKLPFGGLKKSGNFFPTGITAGAYCSHPVASLEVSSPQLSDKPPFPGLVF